MVHEASMLLGDRNTFHWHRGQMDSPQLQFDLNGLWFDHGFEVFRH